MPFEIVRNDITNMCVDAIVNTANPRPVIGSGTDSMIHEKAGPELLAARQKIGNIDRGCAAITPAYNLHSKYVIHTVGPIWLNGNHDEATQLQNCYSNSLRLAWENKCKSIAFPLISTGNYGFPKDKALQIAITAFSSFLLEHEMQIYLVVFDKAAYKLSEKLFHGVASYIDEHFVDLCEQAAVTENLRSFRRRRRAERMEVCEDSTVLESEFLPMASMAPTMTAPKELSLEDSLKEADAGFSETLLNLIDKTGKKDSEIYKKACISKQHFSKIRNNPHYQPTKPTAIAFALALELDLEATYDLIGRAGFTLSKSSKFDLIIRYFIEHKEYNVVAINVALYEFDQTLLGS